MPADLDVELPAGGTITLDSADEVSLWNESMEKYVDDYGISKQNDLTLLGAILTQGVIMYRAQAELMDEKKVAGAQNRLISASNQIQQLEKALGIDKKTREAGGQHTVANYVATLKQSGRAKGIHIASRVKAYEAFMMELRWRLRVLDNADAEDRQHHGVSEATVLDFCRTNLAKLEEADKKWSHEVGKVFIGKL